MYETYLQNEREQLESIKPICDGFDQFCREKGYKQVEGETYMAVSYKNRLARIKEMKALEKELEGEKHENLSEMETGSEFMTPRMYKAIAYNQALDLSLDKIREFISKLEQI